MNSSAISSPTTFRAIKSKSQVSAASVALIVPLVAIGSQFGAQQLGIVGFIIGGLVGFIVGLILEIHLIARRLGITPCMMIVCRKLKPRGNVEVVCNRILSAYALIRQSSEGNRRALDKLATELLKGLDSLCLFPSHQSYATYEDRFTSLVDGLVDISNKCGKGSIDQSTMNEFLSALHCKAKLYSESVIREVLKLRRECHSMCT